MKFDAPLLLLKQMLRDGVRRPQAVRNALAWYANTRSFTYPAGCLPVVSIFDLVPNAEAIPVVMQGIFEIPLFGREDAEPDRRETASTSLRDSYCLALLIKHLSASKIIEVGTSFGESALLFAMNTGESAQVLTLDIQKDNPTIGSCFRNTAYQNKIQQCHCSLTELETKLSAGGFDFIFIDGDHSYQGVLEDSRVAARLLRSGGMLCWHDYSFRFRDDVVRALDHLRTTDNWDIRKLLYVNLCVYVKTEVFL